MSVQLTNNTTTNIPIGLMKDGDIAIITLSMYPEHVGTIVTRYDNHLVALGQPVGKSWMNHFPTQSSSMKVRILQPGAQLTIT